MSTPMTFLSTLRIDRLYRELQDVREIPQTLLFSRRTRTVDATDQEIIARYLIRPMIADIVTDDNRALVYEAGRLETESNAVVNIKHGRHLTQTFINQHRTLLDTAGNVDLGPWRRIEGQILSTLLTDTLYRKEALIIGMYTDTLDIERLGFKLHNMTWGMPAVLKTTAGVAWSDATNATPISDVLTMLQVARVTFGVVYNRLTMSLTAFNYMTRTQDFINRARTFTLTFGANPNGPLPFQNTTQMVALAASLMDGVEIELYDARVPTRDDTGKDTFSPLLPINKVVFTRREFDDDPAVMDFGNCPVTEAVIARQPGLGVIGGWDGGGDDRGPRAYVTGTHNPPNYTLWSVMRGFPRKFELAATAVLTVGAFTDYIPTYEPFAW